MARRDLIRGIFALERDADRAGAPDKFGLTGRRLLIGQPRALAIGRKG
jgi:hypothetical protein